MKNILRITFMLIMALSLSAKNTKIPITITTKENIVKNIPSPGEKNIVLATFMHGKDTVKVREFDIFGVNKVFTVPQMLSKPERDARIKEVVFLKLLSQEAENGIATKNEDYLRLLKDAKARESAVYLFDFLIVPRVVSDELVSKYYTENRTNFSKELKNDKNKIIGILKKEKSKEIAELGAKWLDSASNAYNVEYNEALFKRVAGFNFIAQTTLSDSLDKLTDKELMTALIRCSKTGQSVALKALVDNLKVIPPYAISQFKNVKKLKELINGSILNQILTLEAEKYKLIEHPEVVRRAKEVLKPTLGIINEKILFVDGKFLPTKKETVDYFNKYNSTDKDLWCKRKMNTVEIFKLYDDTDPDSTNDKIKVAIEMENILNSIRNGEDFNKFARLYHREMSNFGMLYWIFKEDNGLIGETASKMKAGEVSELIYHPKAISIIKVTDVNEPRSYSFDYVEEVIKQKLIEQKREKARKSMQAKLDKKYKVKYLN